MPREHSWRAKVQLQRITNYKRCPELDTLLTLHNISKMPSTDSRDIVCRLNCTRQASGGALWKLGSKAYVCNSHSQGFSIDRGVTLSVVSGAILGETECTTEVVQVTTVTTSLSAGSERQRRLLKRPELPSRFFDTSVEDHESEECDTRLATLERDFPQLQEEFLQIKATLAKYWRL